MMSKIMWFDFGDHRFNGLNTNCAHRVDLNFLKKSFSSAQLLQFTTDHGIAKVDDEARKKGVFPGGGQNY